MDGGSERDDADENMNYDIVMVTPVKRVVCVDKVSRAETCKTRRYTLREGKVGLRDCMRIHRRVYHESVVEETQGRFVWVVCYGTREETGSK